MRNASCVPPAARGEIPAWLYVPKSSTPGIVVYLHGGGWVAGELADSHALCRMIAASGRMSVLSLDYRLAPEHPFPAGLEDALAAVTWAAAELSAGGPVVIFGDSAGGNLAAVCAQTMRDRGSPTVALQVLAYPVTDHDLNTRSYLQHAHSYPLGRDDMEWYWNQYLPDPEARGDVRASPLRAIDFTGLPPTLMVVAEHDPLRDDGLAYGKKLQDAGVEVSLRYVADVAHGFIGLATYLERADQVVDEIGAAIRRIASRPA